MSSACKNLTLPRLHCALGNRHCKLCLFYIRPPLRCFLVFLTVLSLTSAHSPHVSCPLPQWDENTLHPHTCTGRFCKLLVLRYLGAPLPGLQAPAGEPLGPDRVCGLRWAASRSLSPTFSPLCPWCVGFWVHLARVWYSCPFPDLGGSVP